MTARERAVLDRMLNVSPTGSSPSANEVRVSGVCGCGCPSIYFPHSEKGQGIEIVADATVVGTHDSVLLFVSSSGLLDSLEYVWLGDTPPKEFPPPDQIVPRRA